MRTKDLAWFFFVLIPNGTGMDFLDEFYHTIDINYPWLSALFERMTVKKLNNSKKIFYSNFSFHH